MKIQSKALTLAHQIKDQFDNWADALKSAWNRIRITKALSKGPTKFKFAKKKTGEIREAVGIVDRTFSNSFSSDYNFNKFCVIRFEEIVTKVVDGVTTTFNQWRSFDIRFLISIGK